MAPSESQTQKLISLYRSCECLWNPQSPGYHSGSVQDDAWRKITREMNSGLTPDQVKLRVLALRNYYDKECAAMRRSQQKGYSHVPRQSYFRDLHFLGDIQCGETEEAKASFCMGQLNCILEDSFILSDNESTINTDYPPNYSQATFCQYTAPSSNRSSESKPGYTLYKLILEPERPSPSRERETGELGGKSNERSTSGNDRWYPTTYCVRCNQCKRRLSRSRSESGSCCSIPQQRACRPNWKPDQECCSCSSQTVSDASCMCCPRTQTNSDNCCCDRNLCEWPGPKLCGQTRTKATPKCCRKTGRDRSYCADNWRRNNDAVCQRLQAQMARQAAQKEAETCNQKPVARIARTCRRSCSGNDQMNTCPWNGNPQNMNCQPPMEFNNNQQITDAGRYSQPGPDPGNYNNSQQMQDPGPYFNNQQVQDPARYSNDQQGQPIYPDGGCAYPMQAAQTNFYQPQQFTQNPTNFGYPYPQPNYVAPGQQYVETEYVPCPMRRSSYPEQPTVTCYAPENPNTWAQPQSGAVVPPQMPTMPPSSTCDFQDSRATPTCRAPCASSGPVDTRRYSEQQPTLRRQEDADFEGYPVNKRDQQWEPAEDPRERPTRGRYQNQGRNSGDEEDIQRGWRNDFDRETRDRRKYREDDWEDPVTKTRSFDYKEGAVRRSREYDDGSPTRDQQRQRNKNPERRKYCDPDCSVRSDYDEGPAGRRQRDDYEENPARGRQRTAENPDLDYDNSPQRRRRSGDNTAQSPKRSLETQTPRKKDQTIFSKNPPPERRKKRQDDEAPLDAENCQPCGLLMSKKGKVFPLRTDESQQDEGPAYNRKNPKECPNLKYKQDRGRQDQSQQDREERIARKTRPPSRNREYEDDEKPNCRCRGSPPQEECESEDEKISSAKCRSKNRPNEETKKPKRRKDDNCCNDETCNLPLRNDKDRSRPSNRQDRYVEKGNEKYKSLKTEVMGTFCTDYTCPYIGNRILDQRAVPKDCSRKRPSKDLNEPTKRNRRESYDDEREPKRSSRNETSAKWYSQSSDDIKDNERPKKGKPKKSYCYCECYSEDNNNDQRRKRKDDRYYDEEPDERSPREKVNKYPRRDDRIESYKYNERSQRGCPRERTSESIPDDDYDGYDDYIVNRGNKKMNDCVDDCACSIATYDTMRETRNRNYRGREESPRNRQKNKDYEEFDCERNTRRTSSSKRNDDEVAPRKPNQRSRGTDVYESDYDYPCSGDEYSQKDDRNPMSSRDPRRGKDDPREPNNNKKKCCEQERSRENPTLVDPMSSKRNTDTSLEDRNYRKYRNDQNDLEDATKDNDRRKDYEQERSRESPTGVDPMSRMYRTGQPDLEPETKGTQPEKTGCDCVREGNEYSKKPNEISAPKTDPVVNDCNCEPLGEPFEPQLAGSPNRNPAGNGNIALNEDIVEPLSKSNSHNKPLEEQTVVSAMESDTAEQAPKKKKMHKPGGSGGSKNVRSSKLKSTSSPTRSSAPLKTQAGEPLKRRAAPRTGASSSPIGRRGAQPGAKRTTDTCAAANSKLPFDLNSASYFTCKLQDDGKTQRYLVVVPKEPTCGAGRHREGPGRGSVKQLHRRRQCSGFQSVSWVNPASACQLRSLHPTEDISEPSSCVTPPVTDTTLLIVKEYLQRSMMQGNPALQLMTPPQGMLKTVLSWPRRRRPVLRPFHKANAPILAENRTVLLTNNPFENLSMGDNKGEVIVLHPPDPGFRPSKNSFSMDAVEVERITVRSTDTDVNPRRTPAAPLLPPRPPTKPKRM